MNCKPIFAVALLCLPLLSLMEPVRNPQSTYDDSDLAGTGWTTRDKAPGEDMGKPMAWGRADGANKEIIINRELVQDFFAFTPGGEDAVCSIIRRHERGHVPGIGQPSDSGHEGNGSTVGNGPCAHLALHIQGHVDACNDIETAIANGDPDNVIETLCGYSEHRAEQINGRNAGNAAATPPITCPPTNGSSTGSYVKCPGCSAY